MRQRQILSIFLAHGVVGDENEGLRDSNGVISKSPENYLIAFKTKKLHLSRCQVTGKYCCISNSRPHPKVKRIRTRRRERPPRAIQDQSLKPSLDLQKQPGTVHLCPSSSGLGWRRL